MLSFFFFTLDVLYIGCNRFWLHKPSLSYDYVQEEKEDAFLISNFFFFRFFGMITIYNNSNLLETSVSRLIDSVPSK